MNTILKAIINKFKDIFCQEDDFKYEYGPYDKLSDYPQYEGVETEDDH